METINSLPYPSENINFVEIFSCLFKIHSNDGSLAGVSEKVGIGNLKGVWGSDKKRKLKS